MQDCGDRRTVVEGMSANDEVWGLLLSDVGDDAAVRKQMVSSSGTLENRLRWAKTVLTSVWDLILFGLTYPLISLLAYMKAARGSNSFSRMRMG